MISKRILKIKIKVMNLNKIISHFNRNFQKQKILQINLAI